MVHTELLDQLESLLYGAGICGGTECTEGMVVGIAFQKNFLAVEAKTEVWPYLHGTYSECLRNFIGYSSVFP